MIPNNGNEAMLKKAQELMERGEFPDDVGGQMLWAGMLAQNSLLGKVLIRLERLEHNWKYFGYIGPVVLLVLGALVAAMVRHMFGG